MENEDVFKTVFKMFKRRKPPPDLSTILNFHELEPVNLPPNVVDIIPENIQPSEILEKLGLKNPNMWQIYQLTDHPGLIFISNPFTQTGIEYWIERCLSSYAHPPNPTNQQREGNSDSDFENFVLNNLRWATLGYHHNWDTKEYSEDFKGEFPPELSLLSHTIADTVGFKNFQAEAAIVNFYALNSSLGGHTDHSEKNMDAPLISISFGQSAIFLLGGTQKSEKPTPILIKNGDIVIMSGKTRLCYHAVPRVLFEPSFSINGQWSSIMAKMRLNMNVRQVNE